MTESNQEIMKCHNPNTEVPMCRECKRATLAKDNEYETFNLKQMGGNATCDGYVSKRETETLF